MVGYRAMSGAEDAGTGSISIAAAGVTAERMDACRHLWQSHVVFEDVLRALEESRIRGGILLVVVYTAQSLTE